MFALFLCLFVCYQNTFAQEPQRIHVDQNVEGGNEDGSSWDHAFRDLQDALFLAEDGDTIWVAAGTYLPTSDNNRTTSFELKDGVAIYGGFSGIESSVEERILGAYESVLSGDIGISGNPTDNTYQVVRSFANGTTTRLDGFTIRDGQATYSQNANETLNKGGGLYVAVNNAHLIGRPKIANCHFYNNSAVNGGAIYCQAEGNTQYASPDLINCRFTENRANIFGGAIYKKGYSGPQGFTLEGCSFEGNRAFIGGGAISVVELKGSINIKNTNFRENSSQGEGGGVQLDAFSGLGNMRFENCFFIDNTADAGGAFYYNYFGFNPSESFEFEFLDCRFDNNKSEGAGGGAIKLQNFYNLTSLKLYRCIFNNNKQTNTQAPGDAIHFSLIDGASGLVDIQNCQFTNNGIDKSAYGGLYLTISEQASFSPNADITIANTLFANNGGALGIINGTGSLQTNIQNCTFHNNGAYPIQKTSGGTGGVINTMSLHNSIIWEPQTPTNQILHNFEAATQNLHGFTIDHTLVSPQLCSQAESGVCGEGILEGIYPVFVDTLEQNYQLAACSPALNLGINEGLDTLVFNTDLGNNVRIMEGQVDLGAFERETFRMNIVIMDTVTCANDPMGAVNVFGNGTPPMLYEWNNGTSTGNYSHNLAAGNYHFTLRDQLGCEDTAEVEIAGPSPLDWSIDSGNPSVFGQADGWISFELFAGGTPPFTYTWNTGDTGTMLSGLLAGDYFLTVTDGNNCVEEFSVVLSNPPNSVGQVDIDQEPILFPNPVKADANIRIVLPEDRQNWQAKVLNIHSQPMKHWTFNQVSKEATIHIPDWPPGVYYLHLSNNSGHQFVRTLMIF
ncbi:MAG: hypothetical protein DHS20C18_31520 [Saprospiraceae bacterium]|nr:MAG: hypothetical protein DHS20C18_31520 [Saprospiraceae bacterium]